jgi:TolB-like protein/DNA-binding winged helix-turn-helix (wHTH) protein
MPVQETSPSRGGTRFGSFVVDVCAGELRKHGIRIKLQDQPFRLLEILLRRPGEIVSREELQRQIWPSDTFVDFDRGLNNAVKRLREALSDSAEQPRYIETLPKRGYRFIASVYSANGDGASATENALPAVSINPVEPERTSLIYTLRKPLLLGGVTTFLLLSAVAFQVGGFRDRLLMKASAAPIRSIAVLPLQNLSGDPHQEYLADRMTEELITDLSQVSALRVASHQSVLRYKGSAAPLPEIASVLDVQALVTGSVQRSGDRMHITAQLVSASEGKNLWAKSYERDFGDALVLQATLAAAIVDEIRLKISTEEQANLVGRTVDPRLLEGYWKLEFHSEQAWDAAWRKGRGKQESEEEYFKAVSSFEDLVRTDPNFIPAYLALAQQVVSMPRKDRAPQAEAGLSRVITLDDSNSNAHLLLAQLLTLFDGQWDAAGVQYRRAIELKPESAEYHGAYAEYLDDFGHFEEGFKEHQRAQDLDPHADYLSTSPLLLPAERVRRMRQFAPVDSYHYWWRGNAEYESRDYSHAFEDWQRAFRDFNWDVEADSFARAYASGGPEAGARAMAKILDQIGNDRWIAPDVIIDAQFYASDKEKALYWLEKAYLRRDEVILHLRSDHRWEPYRSDPRLQAVARRVRLAP